MRNRVIQAHAKSGYRLGLTHIPASSRPARHPRGSRSSGVASVNGRASRTTATATAAYPAALPVTSAVTSTTPSTSPSTCGMPTQPDTAPRWTTGTRSGTAAVSDASIALNPVCAATHPSATPATVCCRARTSRASAPNTAPPSVHKCRRPNRHAVRSDSAPASGLTTTAAAAPIPVTTPSMLSLWAGSIALICTGSSTWIGVKKAIHTPRLASTSSATQRPRTGSVGSARAAGTVVVGVAAARSAALTAGTARSGRGTRRRTRVPSAPGWRSRRVPDRSAG